MKKLVKVDVDFEEFENSGKVFVRQYPDIEVARVRMKDLGFDCYKVTAEYEDYIEVVFGKIIKVYDEN